MKKITRIVLIQLLIIVFSVAIASAQNPGAPPPPDHNSEGTQEQGGRAPIAGGMLILLGLGGAYGAFKTYRTYKKVENCMLD